MAKMQPNDPAYHLLSDGVTSTPNLSIYRKNCYICTDPEFAQLGLPLCRACPECKTGHIAADDTACDNCPHGAGEV